MNIFVTNKNPIVSAKILDDKRVVKMVLESAQLISTALTKLGYNDGFLKPTHINHPCTLWASASIGNLKWLNEHFIGLLNEYHRRYNKYHAYNKFIIPFYKTINYLENKHGLKHTPFIKCVSDKYRDMETFTAYQLTLIDKWRNDKRIPTWYKNKLNIINLNSFQVLLNL